MDPMKEVLCVILGGGIGSRLYPLTRERCKPAVPLFGKHRLIDIPISNCLNSDLRKIYVLTQFKSESLNKHVNRTYKLEAFSKGYVEIMAAEQSMENTAWFQGTADAVRRCLKHFNDPNIKYVLILSGDQLYKMNLRDIIHYHVRNNAQITISCNCVSENEITRFGIMNVDDKNSIMEFFEKPRDTAGLKKSGGKCSANKPYLASMGIYLFDKDVLIDVLTASDKVDFGKEIIPDAIKTKKTFAFIFDGYWVDIGTIKSFYEENLMLTESIPPLDMFDESWQIFTRPRYLPPAKFENTRVERCIVAEGAVVLSSEIIHSIIGLRFRSDKGTVIRDTITMGCDYYQTVDEMKENISKGVPPLGVGKNCFIEKAILDKNVRIGDNVKITNVKKLDNFDGPNYFIRDGIVIVAKNTVIPSGTVI